MIKRKLSKPQERIVLSLVQERERVVAEINEAIDEQSELLRAAFGLPEGKYQFKGDQRGIELVLVEKPDSKIEELDEAAASIEKTTAKLKKTAELLEEATANMENDAVPEEDA